MTPPSGQTPGNPPFMTATHQMDALVAAIDRVGSPACVGIDPDFEKIPRSLRLEGEIEAIEAFSLGVIDCVYQVVPVVKPQSACFERYGSKGYAVLEKVIAKARDKGLIVILDAKRGDIGSSARHYAKGAFDMGANFITVSPYMGPSTIEPFLDAGLGVFALARTSNPDSDVLQLRAIEGNLCVAHAVGSMITDLGRSRQSSTTGLSALGAVVGATKTEQEGETLRTIMKNQMMLVPGVGAQGGTIEQVRPLLRKGATTAGQLGVVVNASRSVIYAEAKGDASWLSTVHEAALAWCRDLKGLVP